VKTPYKIGHGCRGTITQGFTVFKVPLPSKDFQIQSDYLFKEMKKYLLSLDESFTECLCQVQISTEAIDNNRSKARLFFVAQMTSERKSQVMF